jgi:hypothetical protein
VHTRAVNLKSAIKKHDPKAIRAALKAGEEVGYDELTTAFTQPDSVLALLLEQGAVKLDDKDENPLHWLGYEIRSKYPQAARLKRASGGPEPAVITALKKKADLLVAAGAKLDWEAVVRCGRYADAERMLAKTPKLAKQRIADEAPSTIAAYGGAWDVSELIKRIAKGGAVFDAKKAEKTLTTWATKAIAAYAKKHRSETLRRIAFDFDSEGTLTLNADTGKAIRPGDYSASQFADLDTALLDELCALGARALDLLVNVARGLETTKLPIATTKDFKVLVFDHDDEEKQALARRVA